QLLFGAEPSAIMGDGRVEHEAAIVAAQLSLLPPAPDRLGCALQRRIRLYPPTDSARVGGAPLSSTGQGEPERASAHDQAESQKDQEEGSAGSIENREPPQAGWCRLSVGATTGWWRFPVPGSLSSMSAT